MGRDLRSTTVLFCEDLLPRDGEGGCCEECHLLELADVYNLFNTHLYGKHRKITIEYCCFRSCPKTFDEANNIIRFSQKELTKHFQGKVKSK